MAVFRVNTMDGFNSLYSIGGNSTSVYHISEILLGKVGKIIALIGASICPTSSGDTSLIRMESNIEIDNKNKNSLL